MPLVFKGSPKPEEMKDSRVIIPPNDESRLLQLAARKGIDDSNIGSFFVILVAGLPHVVNEEEYQIFSAEELIEQSKLSDALFYDEEKNRLIGTIPPHNKIIEAIQNAATKTT